MDSASTSTYTITLLLVAIAAVSYYLHRRSTYWKRKGIPSYGNVLTGCFKESFTLKKSLADVVTDVYMRSKTQRVIGSFFFGRPILLVNDPEIVKQILTGDFANFNSRGFFNDSKNDPLGSHLFTMDGSEWKSMRNNLSPIFTSGKIKHMFTTLLDCVHKLDSVFDQKKPTVIDTRLVMSSASIQVIASIAFGIDVNCIENPDCEFGTFGRGINAPRILEFFRFMIFLNVHWMARYLRLKRLPDSVENFFRTIVKDTVAHREKNNIIRNDFMDLMIRLKNSGAIEGSLNSTGSTRKGVTDDEIAAQAFLFFVAGFETTSQANTFALLEMAKHPDVQRRVQEECDKVLQETGGEITYDAVNGSMPYTEQVLKETMRLYSALQVLQRSSLKKCKVPLTNIEIDKDTLVWIPNAALHRDPEFFPEPDKFDPERFSEENKSSIPPGVYMPFGDGPRICIGMRFAMVTMKTMMLSLISKFDVDVVENTDLVVKLDPKTFFPNPMGKFYLKFSPRNKERR